jgi:hypothetical protein
LAENLKWHQSLESWQKKDCCSLNFYSTGFRTEQGMLAVLSAYPAQPVSSIIQQFGKFDKLPNLYKRNE